MPVLEITQLRLKGVSADEPAVLKNLSIVRGKLQTNSHFYTCIEDPALIYILGLWPDLDAHLQFLASPACEEVLGPQEHLLEFKWTVHMELDAMASLPLDAPVLSFARLSVDGESVAAFEQAASKDRQTLGGNPHPFVSGWRCDGAPGTHEAVVFTGWETAQAHAAFTARQSDGKDSAMCGKYDFIVDHHARNLERREAWDVSAHTRNTFTSS
ncbi:hypothetical protein BS50DRAFT_326866 [Corynespora cassiicola Philippines]|uniref:ABM domain-containing protein n=1 Tax=Corynespora cassiicola Philippines TaxID=1448308 RepID=A0A2T2NTX8_CORCC|nr:hypothetical protein BS50DRAFT_326866 [Corynespora cassiicola Philippines]